MFLDMTDDGFWPATSTAFAPKSAKKRCKAMSVVEAFRWNCCTIRPRREFEFISKTPFWEPQVTNRKQTERKNVHISLWGAPKPDLSSEKFSSRSLSADTVGHHQFAKDPRPGLWAPHKEIWTKIQALHIYSVERKYDLNNRFYTNRERQKMAKKRKNWKRCHREEWK